MLPFLRGTLCLFRKSVSADALQNALSGTFRTMRTEQKLRALPVKTPCASIFNSLRFHF